MTMFKDYSGRNIRLTDNRLAHILTRSEMSRQEANPYQVLRVTQNFAQISFAMKHWR